MSSETPQERAGRNPCITHKHKRLYTTSLEIFIINIQQKWDVGGVEMSVLLHWLDWSLWKSMKLIILQAVLMARGALLCLLQS